MKLSDYVVDYLKFIGIRHIFEVTGGAVMHLVNSIDTISGIEYVPMAHEQGAAIAADAYSRVTGNIGAAFATSGPGATNLITGICCAYYDSIPVIYITANVPSNRLVGKSGVRQIGGQECDIVSAAKVYTKYSVQLQAPEMIDYVLTKATYCAREGRMGPVLIDIPEDYTRANIDHTNLPPFIPDAKSTSTSNTTDYEAIARMIHSSERPIVVVGKGACNDPDTYNSTCQFLSRTGIPFVCTWPALSCFPTSSDDTSSHSFTNNLGSFGCHGSRYANYAVQNSDLLIGLGTRLDSRAVGAPATFAREADIILVDIDSNELDKFDRLGIDIHTKVNEPVYTFLNGLIPLCDSRGYIEWKDSIERWRVKYNIMSGIPDPPYRYVSPYRFIRTLSRMVCNSYDGTRAVVTVDTGSTLVWTHQAWYYTGKQTMFHAYNFTPMGYALPAAIGARYATEHMVICIAGDGGFMMNIQELATIARHNLDIKIVIMANNEYAMIKNTQDEWMESRYTGSDDNMGLGFPDWRILSKAYGIRHVLVDREDTMEATINKNIHRNGPVIFEVRIPHSYGMYPKLVSGSPIEDQDPKLPIDQLTSDMIINPIQRR